MTQQWYFQVEAQLPERMGVSHHTAALAEACLRSGLSGHKGRESAFTYSRLVATIAGSQFKQQAKGRRKLMPKRSRVSNIGTTSGMTVPDLRSLGEHRSVILVADDEPLIRNVVTLLLQDAGYFVLSADDGDAGLELSRKYQGRIDLVITDVNMPGMNGFDLCGHLMEERPGIKVLVISGVDMRKIMHKATMPFLPKPFDGETLKAKVRKILAAPAQPQNHSETSGLPGMNPAPPD